MFIGALAGDPDAPVTFQTFDDDSTKDKKDDGLAAIFHGPLALALPELERLNASGAGVYVMANGGDGQGRGAKNVKTLRALFVDDDKGHLDPATLAVPPSIVVRSKAGCHVYWRLRPGEPLAAFTPAQEALAEKLGTDRGVKDLPRVLRVPGFLHRKDPADPFQVRLVSTSPAVYTVAEVLAGFGIELAPPKVSTNMKKVLVAGPGIRPLPSSFEQAVADFNAANPLDLTDRVGPCGGCGHNGCAKLHRDDDRRGICYSSNHIPATHGGVASKQDGTACVVFDSLDIHAAQAGVEPAAFLRQRGLWGGGKTSGSTTSRATPKTPGNDPVPATPRKRRAPGIASAVDLWRGEDGIRLKVLGPGDLEFNEMSQAPTVGRTPINIDDAVTTMREIADRDLDLRMGTEDTASALLKVAREEPFHPVREYLNSLNWDGVSRFNVLADQVLRLPIDDDLSRELIHRWFVAAAARALQPGCKVDTVLILVARQGALKSMFFGVLGGAYYADVHADFSHQYRDAVLMLHDSWIAEWAELASIRRAESNIVKQVVTQRIDRLRLPYARGVVELPRAFVIVGTSNEDEFLSDDTGNRRFWVIDLRHLRRGDQIDIQRLEEMRDQLWAEAAARFRAGETWWLPQTLEARLAERHREHTESDPWAHTVLDVADAAGEVTVAQLLQAVKPDVGPGGWTKADQMRIAGILKRDDYYVTRPQVDGRRLRVWVKDRPVPTCATEVGHEKSESSPPDAPLYQPDQPLLGKEEEKRERGRGARERTASLGSGGVSAGKVGQVGHAGQPHDATRESRDERVVRPVGQGRSVPTSAARKVREYLARHTSANVPLLRNECALPDSDVAAALVELGAVETGGFYRLPAPSDPSPKHPAA